MKEEYGIICPLCPNHCALKAIVEDGKVVWVAADYDSGLPCDPCPVDKGRRSIIGFLNSPDRLKYPQKRAGKKGEGKWERISWDEALDTIAGMLMEFKEKFGPESLAMILGEPKCMEFAFGQRFASVFGTPNVITPGNYCGVQVGSASLFTFGDMYINADGEGDPRVMIIWGANPIHTGGSFKGMRPSKMAAAVKKGAKLLLIDPREITAVDPKKRGFYAVPDLWVKPKPGSDGALAMGMIKVIIEEQLYDKEYVSKWTIGFEQLEQHVASYSLKDVERDTWVPEQQIVEAARLYAKNKPGLILWGNGLEQGVSALQSCRAVSILTALTGNVGIPGGEVIIKAASFLRPGRFMLPKDCPRDVSKSIGREFKVAMNFAYVPTQSLVKAILQEKPYPIKAGMVFVSNPVITYPNSKETYEAFMKLDFMVVSDVFMTPTAAIADIVLPAATYFEFDAIGYWPSWFGYLRAFPKIVDPPGECWPDTKMINELAKKVGVGKYFWDDDKEALDVMLEPSGLTLEEFKRKRILWPKKSYLEGNEASYFRTPSGKAEIYSKKLEELGYSPLPFYEEVRQSHLVPSEAEQYPLLMTNAKSDAFMLSSYHSISGLGVIQAEPEVRLNPETAQKAGLTEGEWIYIETKKGRIQQKLVIDPGLDPRVVFSTFGWWNPQNPSSLYDWDKYNINILTDNDAPYDLATGSVQLRGVPCRVYKV